MKTEYDIAIIGGGLAGLATSIQLARLGYAVVLFEKDAYPSHKVCGEYISLESRHFLTSLGLSIDDHFPIIHTLQLTAPNGKQLTTKLPLGGFGISRYLLDSTLANIAIESGVELLQKTKVDNVVFDKTFSIQFSGQTIQAKVCCAAYGKRSNLDVKWNRDFIQKKDDRLNNYVGIKYHVKTNWKEDVIGLHNFKNGYCGISKVENETFCLCYLTTAENLRHNGNNIKQMERNVLFQNPHLKTIFINSEFVQDFPVTISQISFSKKSRVQNHLLMLGDAAGMITPLCGNGMSIALHTSKIAARLIDNFLAGEIGREQMQTMYELQWQKEFASRLRAGRILQSFFGSKTLSNLLVGTFKTIPFLASPLIRLTHGKPF